MSGSLPDLDHYVTIYGMNISLLDTDHYMDVIYVSLVDYYIIMNRMNIT